MKVDFSQKFEKEISKLPYDLARSIFKVINEIYGIDSLEELVEFKKLKGAKNVYALNFGIYRIGIKVIKDKANIITIGERSTFYNKFP
jgi:mRNA-degrading endonuclease RelE of RelBE toxin-antitoxin system